MLGNIRVFARKKWWSFACCWLRDQASFSFRIWFASDSASQAYFLTWRSCDVFQYHILAFCLFWISHRATVLNFARIARVGQWYLLCETPRKGVSSCDSLACLSFYYKPCFASAASLSFLCSFRARPFQSSIEGRTFESIFPRSRFVNG
jgi:hypothetical protein